MSGLDHNRVALVVAQPADSDAPGRPSESVGTGYFLTGDLVLTTRHIGDRPDCTFSVRTEVGGQEKEHWSSATPVWNGVGGDVDAMLLRTARSYGDWDAPTLRADIEEGKWKSAGFPKVSADEKNRKTLPLYGSFGTSYGQGFPELALQTKQNISSKWETYWRGVSGAPVFLEEPGGGALVGIVTDAHPALSNGLVGLPATRLLEDIHFRSAIAPPSFLGQPPSKPWCLVLTSEGSASDLVGNAGDVLAGRFPDLHSEPIEVPVLDAVKSVDNWVATVEALARSDYLIADVTSYEPAVMLLLGIRSVLRRGVTVSVTSADPVAHASSAPFNVKETKVLASNDQWFYENLHRAMVEGAANLAQDSNYLDLPAYHAVRAPRPKTWAEDDARNLLVLCPFTEDYSELNWKKLRSIIQGRTHDMTPLRMRDLRSPRLVGQALYEQIRWSTRCLVDWSEWRPNVFFELGVRLACSEHDPLCVIQRENVSTTPDPDGPQLSRLRQHDLLRQLLHPVEYDRAQPRDALKDAIEWWLSPPRRSRRAPAPQVLPPAATFEVAQARFLWDQEKAMLALPHTELREAAESIQGKDPQKDPERLILFADNERFDAELRAAVRERWIAAWLYLRHLTTSDDTPPAATQAELSRASRFALLALSKSSDPRHVRLRKEIREFLRADGPPRRARGSDRDSGR
jgi:hypothetical protein